MKLDSTLEILDVRTQYDSVSSATQQSSILPTVFGQEGELFYKFLDANIFILISAKKNDRSTIDIKLVNSVTGRVIHQFMERNVSPSSQHPIATLFSEHYFAISFMRMNTETGIYQQELTVIELYSKKQEVDTQQLLTDYFKGVDRIVADSYSSFREESQPEVLSESYIIPFGIKAMALTETTNHITGRAMILVTNDNQVYSMREMVFSARRPRPDLEGPALSWMEQAAKEASGDFEEEEKSM